MNILPTMRTVDAILEEVYGGKTAAVSALQLKSKNSPWNWSSWGHFPAHVAIKISRDAKEKGIELPLEEIPVMDNKAGEVA